MATVSCPVEGLEHLSISYPAPDEWRYIHKLQFSKGWSEAEEDAPFFIKALLGVLAIVKIEGEDFSRFENIGEAPLHLNAFFDWLVVEVYPKYQEALRPPEKNSSEE